MENKFVKTFEEFKNINEKNKFSDMSGKEDDFKTISVESNNGECRASHAFNDTDGSGWNLILKYNIRQHYEYGGKQHPTEAQMKKILSDLEASVKKHTGFDEKAKAKVGR